MNATLLEHCADDLAVVNAARVSYDTRVEEVGDRDKGLINYLMRNKHGTPFEHGYFRFHVEAPIFVFRQWHRHRAGHSYNEMSGRYVELGNKFFLPREWFQQVGKPGAYTYIPILEARIQSKANGIAFDAFNFCWDRYKELLSLGIAKEQARVVLPLATYSQMHWSCNPRSLMHFVALRNAPDASKEIQELAKQVEKAFQAIMPITAQAFIDNERVAP